MTSRAETRPLVAERYHDDPLDNGHEEEHFDRVLPASAHHKRAIKILTIIIAALSISMFGLLIAEYVLVEVGNFNNTWATSETTRDLFIVLFTTSLVTTPSIFLAIPILLNLLVHLIMSIVIFVFAGQMFANGWPDRYFCGRWVYDPGQRYGSGHWDSGSQSCEQRMTVVRILMGIGGGLSFIVAVLLLTTTLLQIVALAKSRSWRNTNYKRYASFDALRNWKPQGFTIQFTLTIMPPMKQNDNGALANAEAADTPAPAAGQGTNNTEGGRLIET